IDQVVESVLEPEEVRPVQLTFKDAELHPLAEVLQGLKNSAAAPVIPNVVRNNHKHDSPNLKTNLLLTSCEEKELQGLDKSSLPANLSPPDAWEQWKFYLSLDDTTQNALLVHETSDTLAHAGIGGIPDASCHLTRQFNRKRFFADFRASLILFGQSTIGFEYQYQRLFQVFPPFFQCFSLRVGPRHFFDVRDIPLPLFLKNRGKLAFHKYQLL